MTDTSVLVTDDGFAPEDWVHGFVAPGAVAANAPAVAVDLALEFGVEPAQFGGAPGLLAVLAPEDAPVRSAAGDDVGLQRRVHVGREAGDRQIDARRQRVRRDGVGHRGAGPAGSQGAAGPRGGGRGDLYVLLRVANHERFRREGDELVEELWIPMTQAALGARLDYATLDGDEELVIPAGTVTGEEFRLRGRGVPRLNRRGRGDLVVRVIVETPTDLTSDQEALIREVAALRGEEVAPADEGWLKRIRSAFS